MATNGKAHRFRTDVIWFLLCWALACLTGMAGGGCSTLGPRTIRGDRFNYNKAGADSSNEQLLLNIVRLRYGEPIYWLEIGSMLSQYTFDAGVSFNTWDYDVNRWKNPALRALFGVRPDPAPTDGRGINFGWSDRPTITYSPLQGEEFAKRLMTPIPAATIMYLAQSGWRIDQVFECCVQRVNDVDNSPIHDVTAGNWVAGIKFQTMTDVMKKMQDAGKLRFSLEFDADEQATYLYSPAGDLGMGEEAKELAELLDLSTDASRIKLIDGGSRHAKDELAIQTRSLLGTMYALSQLVEAPPEHLKNGEIRNPYTPDEEADEDPWLVVKYSRVPVPNAMAQIFYRGYWFYVPRTDWSSKRTFALLTYLFSLQASGTTTQAPMVTVQAGGR